MTHTFGYGVCVFIAEIEAFDDLSLYLFSDGLSFRRRIVNCETSRDVLWSVVCGLWSVVVLSLPVTYSTSSVCSFYSISLEQGCVEPNLPYLASRMYRPSHLNFQSKPTA